MMFAQWLMVLPPLVLVSAVFAFPMSARPGIWFGVSVPLEFVGSATARRMQMLHLLRCACLLVVSLAITAVELWRNVPVLLPVAVALNLGGGLALWTWANRTARRYGVQSPLVRTASLSLGQDSFALGTLLLVSALVPLVLSAVYLSRHYVEMPLQFPQHWDQTGGPDHWVDRTP